MLTHTHKQVIRIFSFTALGGRADLFFTAMSLGLMRKGSRKISQKIGRERVLRAAGAVVRLVSVRFHQATVIVPRAKQRDVNVQHGGQE